MVACPHSGTSFVGVNHRSPNLEAETIIKTSLKRLYCLQLRSLFFEKQAKRINFYAYNVKNYEFIAQLSLVI